MVAIEGPVAVHEIPFGALERSIDGTEYPGQGWVDVSGRVPGGRVQAGLAVLNDGKPGVDVRDGEIGLTVVRSPAFAHHEPAPFPTDERAVFLDQGLHRFRYGLLPHAGPAPVADLTRAAAGFGLGPVTVLESFHDGPLPAIGSFLRVEPDTVLVTAAKIAEDGDDLVVRCRETTGVGVDATIRVGLGGRPVPLAIGPYQIRTLRIPRDPAAPVVEVDLVEWPVEQAPAAPDVSGAPSPALPRATPPPVPSARPSARRRPG